MSSREVAVVLGVGKTTVCSLIQSAGISRPRKPRACTFHRRANHCEELDNEFIDYLDGLLISDGSLIRPVGCSIASYYRQSCVYAEWLTSIADKFKTKGIDCSITADNRRIKPKKSCYSMATPTYVELCRQYRRWYPSGEKKVPRDINLGNVDLIKNWIYGDGTLLQGNSLRFCCDSFSIEDVEFLISKFADMGWLFGKVWMGKSKMGNDKWRLSLCKRNGLGSFYEWLGEPEVRCYSYKWAVNKG
jgi:hypothetical protein